MADFIPGSTKIARANYVGADNLPAEVQGEGAWTVTPTDAVTFAHGWLARVATKLANGFVITASYDADLRDGEGFITDLPISSDPHNIVAPQAVGGVVTLE